MPREFSPERRRLLRSAGGLLTLGAAGLVSAAGCKGGESKVPDQVGYPVLRIPLADLPPGGRHRVMQGKRPVELLREGHGVTALSLWCTHYGCVVNWKEDRQLYLCACHEGWFDAQGNVLQGPPTRPLKRVPARIEGDVVVVGEEAAAT